MSKEKENEIGNNEERIRDRAVLQSYNKHVGDYEECHVNLYTRTANYNQLMK